MLNAKAKERRVDWVFSDPIEKVFGQLPEPESPAAPTFVERARLFSSLVRRWVTELAPPMTRMAVGAVLELPTQTRDESYVILSRYLNFDLDPATSSDFHFQINRFRDSHAISGLRVNRLTKWSASVSMVRSLRMMISQDEATAVDLGEEQPRTYACQIETDLNTVHRDTPMPADRLGQQFDELTEMLEELVREGDV